MFTCCFCNVLLIVEREKRKRRSKKAMEETSKSIAHQIGGVQNDALRFGLHGVKSDIVGSHPLQSSLESVISLSLLFSISSV